MLAYLVNALGYALCVCALGLLGATLCRSLQQLNAIIHIGALLLAATCGAFIPVSQMPAWIQQVAEFTPSFWLVDVQKQVLLASASWVECVPQQLALFGLGLW